MNRDAFDRAGALLRAWTWFYTLTVSPELRERRRREIDADLWEAAHDEACDRSALLLLLRAGGGLVDDVRWSLEQPQEVASLAGAFVTLGTLALAGWLVMSYTLRVADMPIPSIEPTYADYGPPPPPPPPPCLPAGMPGSPTPCAR